MQLTLCAQKRKKNKPLLFPCRLHDVDAMATKGRFPISGMWCHYHNTKDKGRQLVYSLCPPCLVKYKMYRPPDEALRCPFGCGPMTMEKGGHVIRPRGTGELYETPTDPSVYIQIDDDSDSDSDSSSSCGSDSDSSSSSGGDNESENPLR